MGVPSSVGLGAGAALGPGAGAAPGAAAGESDRVPSGCIVVGRSSTAVQGVPAGKSSRELQLSSHGARDNCGSWTAGSSEIRRKPVARGQYW